jgi:hypothetical protein
MPPLVPKHLEINHRGDGRPFYLESQIDKKD